MKIKIVEIKGHILLQEGFVTNYKYLDEDLALFHIESYCTMEQISIKLGTKHLLVPFKKKKIII